VIHCTPRGFAGRLPRGVPSSLARVVQRLTGALPNPLTCAAHDLALTVALRDGQACREAQRSRDHRRRQRVVVNDFLRPVLEIARQLVCELKWSGVANLDFRVEAGTGRPLVLELNGRYWASLLASTAAGVNFPDLQVRTTLGERIAPPQPRFGRFVQPRAYGRDLLRLHPRLLRCQWTDFWDHLADPLPGLMARAVSLSQRLSISSSD